MGANAGEQLGEPKRLGHVVVGAGVEPGDDVELAIAGGEDQDREIRAGAAQVAADRDPVDVRESEVEDHDAHGWRRRPQRPPALGHLGDLEALLLEDAHQPLCDRLIVLDHQHVHSATVAPARGPRGRPRETFTGR